MACSIILVIFSLFFMPVLVVRERPELDLSLGEVSAAEQRRRLAISIDFDEFLQESGSFFRFADYMDAPQARELVKSVVAFGQHLYNEERPRAHFSRLILHIRQQRPDWKYALAGCWDALARWELAEPAETRLPCPSIIVFAMMSVAFLWGWTDVALCLGLAFEAGLRIGEIVSRVHISREASRMLWEHVTLPEDVFGLSRIRAAYLTIDKPKTRGKSATKQVGRIESREMQDWLRVEREFCAKRTDRRLIPLSYAQMTHRFSSLLAEFGLEKSGLTLGTLRPGRATELFEATRDMDWVRRLLRHDSILSTDRYIQEVQAASVGLRLSQRQKDRIREFADAAPFLLQRHLSKRHEVLQQSRSSDRAR